MENDTKIQRYTYFVLYANRCDSLQSKMCSWFNTVCNLTLKFLLAKFLFFAEKMLFFPDQLHLVSHLGTAIQVKFIYLLTTGEKKLSQFIWNYANMFSIYEKRKPADRLVLTKALTLELKMLNFCSTFRFGFHVYIGAPVVTFFQPS